MTSAIRGTELVRTRPLSRALVVWVALLLAGCVRTGHKAVVRDRFDYSSAISRSWQEQMLLNLVRLRYVEPPLFLDVSQVVAQYTAEGSAALNAPDWLGAPAGSAAGISGRWAVSPTITFSPMTGETFTKSLLKPISPVSLLSLVQVGWPVDGVFSVGVRAINGLHARSRTTAQEREADADFTRLLSLLRELQTSDQMDIRVQKGADQGEGAVVTIRTEPTRADLAEKGREVRRLLGLDPEANEFTVSFGTLPQTKTDLAFVTRSLLEVLSEASTGVQVPARDLREQRAPAVPDSGPAGPSAPFLVDVHCSERSPPRGEALTAVSHRGRWFWISDRDLDSKRGIMFLLVLFTLAESSTTVVPPVLTISRP
jgi:hypothetical protein